MSNFNISEKFYDGPILIPHHEHPVIHCFHDNTFNCNICKSAFIEEKQAQKINKMGSFCCTLCNLDICDNCFGEIELYKIVFYEPNQIKNKDNLNNNLELSDRGWKKFKCHHIHSMPLIIKGTDQFGWEYICSECHKSYATYSTNNQENVYISKYLYYCSICDYCLCIECAKKNIITKK